MPRPDYPSMARAYLEGVCRVRSKLEKVRPLIGRIRDRERRQQLEEEYRRAEIPLIQAIEAGHAFSYDELEERLSLASRRAEVLLEKVANPVGS